MGVEAGAPSKNGSFAFQLSPVVPCVREQKYILNFFSLFRRDDLSASRPHKGQLVTAGVCAPNQKSNPRLVVWTQQRAPP